MKRTRAQRRWNKQGYTHEMIPLRPQFASGRISYLLGRSESWRASRRLGEAMYMPVRRVAMVFIHNGRKPR